MEKIYSIIYIAIHKEKLYETKLKLRIYLNWKTPSRERKDSFSSAVASKLNWLQPLSGKVWKDVGRTEKKQLASRTYKEL